MKIAQKIFLVGPNLLFLCETNIFHLLENIIFDKTTEEMTCFLSNSLNYKCNLGPDKDQMLELSQCDFAKTIIKN